MRDIIFYVKDNSKPQKLVRAKFFEYEGEPYVDTDIAHARSTPLYDAAGKLLPTQNVNGYLIVPDDFDLQNSVHFAQSVSRALTSSIDLPDGEKEGGLLTALGMMGVAFADGPQDTQRSYGGRTGQPFVSAFTDAASFNLGLVSAYSGIPLSWADEGGGIYNRISSTTRVALSRKRPLDTSGVDGLSKLNENSIKAGYQFGGTLRGSASYVPLHREAWAIGKAQRSVSVAPKVVIRRAPTGARGRAVLPGVIGVPVPLRVPRSDGAKGVAGRSSAMPPRASSGLSLAAASASGLEALKLKRLRPRRSAVPARMALAGAGDTDALAAAGKGGLPEAAVAPRGCGVRASALAGAMLPERPAGTRAGAMTAGVDRAEAALAVARMARRREPLPSVAPGGGKRLARRQDAVEVRRSPPAAGSESAMPRVTQGRAADVYEDEQRLDRVLSDFFDRQSRLPPSGATGFDPRLSPAWPGLKLPA